jgi:hypothetical protein
MMQTVNNINKWNQVQGELNNDPEIVTASTSVVRLISSAGLKIVHVYTR